jgi:hypothetical protein
MMYELPEMHLHNLWLVYDTSQTALMHKLLHPFCFAFVQQVPSIPWTFSQRILLTVKNLPPGSPSLLEHDHEQHMLKTI